MHSLTRAVRLLAVAVWALTATSPGVAQDVEGVEIEYIAHACFRLHSPEGSTVLIDPFASRVWIGYDLPADLTADAVLVTHPHYDHDGGEWIGRTPPWSEDAVVYREPGEYTVGDIVVRGVRGKHADPWGHEFGQLNTIWRIEVGGVVIVHLGDNGPLTEEIVTELGRVDVLMTPLDGHDHILKRSEVRTIRDALQPSVVIPMHYRHPGLEQPGSPKDLGDLEPALEGEMRVERLRGNRARLTRDSLPDQEQILVLRPSPRMWRSMLASPAVAEQYAKDGVRGRELRAREGERPDLMAIELPILEVARNDPEALWSFLTDPKTPYTDAFAAAMRCRPVFSVELMPRLIRAQMLLERETELHNFGLRPHPLWHYRAFVGGKSGFPGDEWTTLAGTTRNILGREWVVPDQTSAFPILWDDACAAPWPLRVYRILRQAWNMVAPRGATERAHEWVAVCLRLPLENEDDVMLFVRATYGSMHLKSVEIVARWKKIALDPRFAPAAVIVAGRLGEVYRQWDDARGQLAVRTLAADLIALAPDEKTRQRCVSRLGELSFTSSRQDSRGPAPAGAILAACNLANDPAAGSEYARLYHYAMGVCLAVDDPPFIPDRNMDPESPVVREQLELFNTWAASLRGRWEHELEQERVMRAELERLGGK